MNTSDTPRPYTEWRTNAGARAEDAAYQFGYHMMRHCRAEALEAVASASVPTSAEEMRALAEKAVDTALHNVVELLEGFWRTEAGAGHRVEYALSVCVKNGSGETLERIDISPCMLDLPIGYWKWKDGEFR